MSAKRLFDLFLSSFGMIIFFPLGLLFALLIKLEDGGPIFYQQYRWGKKGVQFLAYKFRTMVPNADPDGSLTPALENDVRMTHIGKFLRAMAMDELPQLINIWKGDMSFVGPRALAVQEIELSFPRFLDRHCMRPGLTGPAQIYASRDASLDEKFAFDLEYIRHRNFFSDLKLIFLSVYVTLCGKWESRGKKV